METVYFIFSIIGIVVTVASTVIKVVPAVDKNGIIGKIIWCFENFSVFSAKSTSGDADADQG